MKHTDWEVVTLLLSIAAVVISIVSAITFYNIEERRTMVRAGMCEVFRDPPRAWVWEKCK